MSNDATERFQELAGHFDYPMFIVTTAVGDERSGCLVGFATQCSVDPARFVVFLSDKNHTFRVAKNAEALGVHMVPSDALDLARLFGEETGDDVDKLERCEWKPGAFGVPLLEACGDRFVGRIAERISTKGGDHLGFVLEPVEVDAGGRTFLPFSKAKELEPGHEA